MGPSTSTRVRVFLTCWIVYSLFFATNVVREHYPAFSLIERGDWVCDDYAGFHSDIFEHTDGHWYVGNNVLGSLFAIPPLLALDPVLDALQRRSLEQLAASDVPPDTTYDTKYPLRQEMFRKVKLAGLDLRFGASTAITSVLLMAPLSALLAVLMFHLLCQRGLARERALWLTWIFAFGTPVFFRTAHLNHNMFLMEVLFGAFALLWTRPGTVEPLSVARRALAGFLCGMAMALDYAGFVPAGVLALYFVGSRARTVGLGKALAEAVPCALAALPPLGFLLGTQWAMYGDAFKPGQFVMRDVNYTDKGLRGMGLPNLEVFLKNLFSPSYGMLLFAPVLALGFLPTWRYPQADLLLPRNERRWSAFYVLAFLLFCAANWYSLMQFNTGFRYLLPVVPFVFLAACDHLARLPRGWLVALALASIAHQGVLSMAREVNDTEKLLRDRAEELGVAETSLEGYWEALLTETPVPVAYRRLVLEGPQLPWLTVLGQTQPARRGLLGSPFLVLGLFGLAGAMIYGVWRVGSPRAAFGQQTPPPLRSIELVMTETPLVHLVIPCLNEAHVLEKSVATVRDFLTRTFPYRWGVLIADNGSTDGTREIAQRLAETYPEVRAISLDQRGRGRALRRAWSQSEADIMAYCDVDLSTELEALEKCCRAIWEEGYDIATGSRLHKDSDIVRGFKRDVISRCYNLLIKAVLFTSFSDAQCGFKAVSRRAVKELLPQVQDEAWFFDTELLVLGEKEGYRIKDVPVRWIDDDDSRVKIVSTAWEDIKGVMRLRSLLWSKEFHTTTQQAAARHAEHLQRSVAS